MRHGSERQDLRAAVADYLMWLKIHKETSRNAELKLNAYPIPALGDKMLADPVSATLNIAESKSGKPPRVYLTDDGKAAFESWTAGRLESGVIFKDRFGNPCGSHDQHRPMAAACKAAGIEPAIGMHTLRHSYASSRVQAGVSLLAIVAEALGHAETRMVSKHYGHLAPSHLADAIRAHWLALGVELDNKVTRLRP